MDPLDLYVEHRVEVDALVDLIGDGARERGLAALMRCFHLLLDGWIFGVRGKALQRPIVVEPPLAEGRANDTGEPRIALDQPATEGDAVGLVGDAAGIDGIEGMEHRLAHQVGVERRDAVDFVRADEGEVAHSHPPAGVLVDHRNRRQQALIDEAAPPRAVQVRRIDQVDDLHVAGQHPLHQRHRPGLERFRQQGVVGIGEHRLRDRPRLVPFDLVEVDEDAHQFGDPDRRMGVIELDSGVLAERAHVAPLLDVAANEIEQRRRSEEIFLSEPQFLAGRSRVAGVENLGDRFRPHGFRKRADVVAGVERIEFDRIDRARRPQAQRVDVPAAPADDRRVVGDRFDRLGRMPDVVGALIVALDHFDPAAEADGVIVFGADEFPRIAVDEPVLGGFLLPAAADDLAE